MVVDRKQSGSWRMEAGGWLLEEMTKANVSGFVSGWLGFVSRLVRLLSF